MNISTQSKVHKSQAHKDRKNTMHKENQKLRSDLNRQKASGRGIQDRYSIQQQIDEISNRK